MVNVLDYGIVENKFELQSRYYIHFRINIHGKSYEPPYHLSYGLNSSNFDKNSFGIE